MISLNQAIISGAVGFGVVILIIRAKDALEEMKIQKEKREVERAKEKIALQKAKAEMEREVTAYESS